MAPKQPQRPTSVSAVKVGSRREPAQPAMSGGPPRQSADSLLRVTSASLQQQAPTYPTESAEATAPARYQQLESHPLIIFLCGQPYSTESRDFINNNFLCVDTQEDR